jgi:FkbM family methyltransferase
MRGAVSLAHSTHVLSVLDYYLKRHFPNKKALTTVEIGTSDATEKFAQRASAHFCLVEPPAHPSFSWASLWPRNSPRFVSRGVAGLALALGSREVDVLLFSEEHRFPHWHAVFDALVPKLAPGAIVVLPQLDIKSVHQLYEILREDDRFNLHLTMERTAFLGYQSGKSSKERSVWRPVAYDRQNFPAMDHLAYRVPLELPVKLDFTGFYRERPPQLTQGFRLWEGRPFIDGEHARVELHVDPKAGSPIGVNLELALRASLTNGFTARANGTDMTVASDAGGLVATCSSVVTPPEDGHIAIELSLPTIKSNGALQEQRIDIDMEPAQAPALKSVAIHKVAGEKPRFGVTQHQGSVVSFEYEDEHFHFFVTNPHDSIQAHHANGCLYEPEELNLIRKRINPEAAILDVGANIGNHVAYFEKILKAREIVAIEIQRQIIELLKINCRLNGIKNVDLSFVGVGLGAHEHAATINIQQQFNPAGGSLREDAAGPLKVTTGDKLFPDRAFDFVKIDVEGMECAVIQGLESLIRRCQPAMFVEVWDNRRGEFDQLMERLNYKVVDEFRRYDIATNLFIVPR